MKQRYYAVTSKDGLPELRPFKEWFRATQGVSNAAEMNTHQMREHMRRKGWSVKHEGDQVLIINPEAEGLSSIAADDDVAALESSGVATAEASLFALESHLRDYLAKNLNSIIKVGSQLSIVGVEYSTDVGPIDLLARNAQGDYYVFELKLDRGADAALGQLLRYMGWCRKHLSQERQVFGIILAAEISEKLRYAATQVPNVTLLEYELQFRVLPVPTI